MSTLFLDPVGGLAGDMITAALLDLGAPLSQLEAAIAALPVTGISVDKESCMRGPFAATRFIVSGHGDAHHHRTWHDIRDMLNSADLVDGVRTRALQIFEALAHAEASVHGTEPDEVHFHEVGAWDSIADIVGVSAALEALQVTELVCGPPPLGSGTISTAHGQMPLPGPATVSLLKNWPVRPGPAGRESTTPTGAAIISALGQPGSIPAMVIDATGVGAGTRDSQDIPNVVRAFLGHATSSDQPPTSVFELLSLIHISEPTRPY